MKNIFCWLLLLSSVLFSGCKRKEQDKIPGSEGSHRMVPGKHESKGVFSSICEVREFIVRQARYKCEFENMLLKL